MSAVATAVDDNSPPLDALVSATDGDNSLHSTLEPDLPFDPRPYWWGGYDTVPDLLYNAAAFTGVTYLAGSLCLRFSNRIRWGTVSPNFRHRRMVLALASGLYGTRLGCCLRTEDISDAIAEVPFLAAPCLNLVYYPWILSKGEDGELRKKVDQMRIEYEEVRKEQGMPEVDAESPDNEGIRSRIVRMACRAWSTPETRAVFDTSLRYTLRESMTPPVSHRDIELAVIQLATAAEYEERSDHFLITSGLFYASALMRVFTTHPFLYRHSLWLCGLSLLLTLYSRIQDYILFFAHCHVDQQLPVALSQELEFQMRPPLHSGMKPWEAPEDDPDAVVTVTLTPKAKPSSGP